MAPPCGHKGNCLIKQFSLLYLAQGPGALVFGLCQLLNFLSKSVNTELGSLLSMIRFNYLHQENLFQTVLFSLFLCHPFAGVLCEHQSTLIVAVMCMGVGKKKVMLVKLDSKNNKHAVRHPQFLQEVVSSSPYHFLPFFLLSTGV